MQGRLLDRVMVMNVTIVLEAVLLLIAAVWIQLAHLTIAQEFVANKRALIIGVLAGLGTASSGFILLFIGKLLKDNLQWISSLRKIVMEEVAPLFAELTLFDILLVALASGFCEEVFFRGVMQAQIGYLPTSILFGLFHCPSLRHISYGIWAFSAALLLGFLLDYTGTLWTPIVAHALSNFIVITYLRYGVKAQVTDV
jgi:membrane protease YdiL (CAAX protease family)